MFNDRREAGALLGAELARLHLHDPVVLGLPRGGVPVAAEVALALGAPLDVISVRKLGVPFRRELAMGAIGEDGAMVLNDDVVRMADVTPSDVAEVAARERIELEQRLERVRAVRPRQPLHGRSAVIVDDGVATGATMRAAIRVLRVVGAGPVTAATPVAPPNAVAMLATVADRVVCLVQPEPFWAVGTWYRHFEAVDDEEVLSLLVAAAARMDSGGTS